MYVIVVVKKGHFFADCLKKRHCPWCKIGFGKCFDVEKDTKNKEKLFNCCSVNCKYWKCVENGESSSGESSWGSSSGTVNSNNHAAVEEDEHLSRLLHTHCRVTEDKIIKIQLVVTIRNANESVEVDKKGKGPS